ncbi:MAG TPA: RNA methyltransferase [Phycisphaerales bacterium]|nr:RNA methyltransferase [Phycisphaerales bacterium]
MPPLNIIPLCDPGDPRLADYADVKERQLAAEFGGVGVSGSPGAPHGKFYAEGKVVLHHLVRSGHATLSVLATPAMVEVNRGDLELLAPGVPVYTLPHAAMERVIGFTIHRGLLAVGARQRPLSTAELLAGAALHGGPLVVLEDLSNHDNIGAIFRNAAALGASGVLLSPRCADPLYRKSLRVSVGLALRVPWATAERWPEDLERVHEAGFESLALTPGGERTLTDLASDRSKGIIRGLALLVGAEGPGLSGSTLAAARHRVRIPMAGGVDSLNAATSCAVSLYELGRLAPPPPPLC